MFLYIFQNLLSHFEKNTIDLTTKNVLYTLIKCKKILELLIRCKLNPDDVSEYLKRCEKIPEDVSEH